MTDLHGPRDLHHSLIEKTVQIGSFARSPAEVDQDPHECRAADVAYSHRQRFVARPRANDCSSIRSAVSKAC
jgi:hypothetical protein